MQKAGLYTFCFFVFLLLLFYPAKALLAQEFSLKNYAVDDGVPSPEVYCALQDVQGYMWFGTDRGVCKFNGYKFESFTSAEGLCYNTVFQIHTDHKSRIWFLSNSNQLCFYDGTKIRQHPANEQLKNLFPSAVFNSFHCDAGDTLWLTVNEAGIIKITPDNKVITVRNSQRLQVKIFDDKNYIFTSRKTNLLTFEQTKPNRKTDIYFNDSSLINPLVIRTSKSEFFIAHGLRNTLLTRIDSGKIKQTQKLNYQVICVQKANENEIWVGSRSMGLYCYKNNNFTSPVYKLLNNTTISSILKDKEGNFWLTTLEDGIYLLRAVDVLSYPAIDEEDNNKYSTSYNDGENLWIGTDKGFTYKVDKKNTFYRYSKLESAVTTILQTKENKIWIGSNNGLHVVSGNRLLAMASEPIMLRIFKGNNNNIFGSRGKFLYIFKNGKWQYCGGKNEGLNSYIDAIAEDKNGLIWMACNDGLWQYSIRKQMYIKITSVNVRINDLKFTKNQSLWMASQGNGVILIENGKQKSYNKSNGLLSNLCNHIYIDKNENIWISTYKGLNCINKTKTGSLEIKAITTKDGLISNEVLECCEFQNKMWVFTGNGISVFEPARIKPDTFSPPTYITGVNINAANYTVKPNYKLNYHQNNITINFAGLYFKNAGKVRYRYKMKGIDTTWNYTENTVVQYGTLQPGTYEFIVAAQNNAGHWESPISKIQFVITPPFWQTLWFKILLAFIILLLVIILVNIRIRYLVKRKNLMNELEGYKNRALQARMNPHFIFNSLNSINNYILQNDKQNSSKYLSKFGSLMRFILDNSVRTDISLETEMRGLQLYLELEKQRFKEKLTYSINISPDINILNTKIPALILQPFVENAILHGILPKDGSGHVDVIITKSDGKIKCIIEDNGIGRKKALEKAERKSPGHISNGIQVTKQRLDIINKLHHEKTELKITDLYNDEGVSTGTRVELSWPIY